jgi:hypothetical protein
MERIICAAIHYKDAPTPTHTVTNVSQGLILCGMRHPDIIGQCSSLTGKRTSEMGPYEQGFLTTNKRFVDREEAFKIALEAGQILDLTKTRGEKLYSEDLY